MYTISDYGVMIADSVRTATYDRALRQAVKPGDIVLDLGAGIGTFAILAAKYGATKVYAIETNDAINSGPEIAAANGQYGVIKFVQERSTQIVLPETVDIVISDLRGVLPLFGLHIPSISDVRSRLLKPGGILISQRDTLWIAGVQSNKDYTPYDIPWRENIFNLNMEAARNIVTNLWRKVKISPNEILLSPQIWGTLEYSTIKDPDIAANTSWVVEADGVLHGFAAWFDATLIDGISFSNAPDQPELIYGNAFFPLSEATEIVPGDRVELKLRADLIGEDYVWAWNTHIQDASGKTKASFRQSTFWGGPLALKTLHKTAANYEPHLTEGGQIDLAILQLMSQSMSLGEIAGRIQRQFPGRFSSNQEALTHAAALAGRYS